MLKKITYAFLAFLVVSFTSCSKIDDLQSDLDELVKENEELEKEISELNKQLEEQYNITGKTYYGDVLTSSQFDSIESVGYTKIIGQVQLTNSSQVDQLSSVAYVGKDLVLNGVSSVELVSLQIVGGNVLMKNIFTDESTISFPVLSTVGGNFTAATQGVMGLTSLELPSLELVSGDLDLDFSGDGKSINTLTFGSLDFVAGNLTLSNTNDISILDLESLSFVGGDFLLSGLPAVPSSSITLSSLTNVGGNLHITDVFDRFAYGDADGNPLDRVNLEVCNALEYVGGYISVEGFHGLDTFSGFNSIESTKGYIHVNFEAHVNNFFSALTSVEGGIDITLPSGGSYDFGGAGIPKTLNAFNALVSIKKSVRLDAAEILGFDKVAYLGQKIEDQFLGHTNNLEITAESYDAFPVLTDIAGQGGESGSLLLKLKTTNATNLFTELTTRNVAITVELDVPESQDNAVGVEFIGFNKVETAQLINITFEKNITYSEFDAFGSLNFIKVGDDDSKDYFKIQVKDENADLSSMNTYFEASYKWLAQYDIDLAQYDIDKAQWDLEFEQWELDLAQYEIDHAAWLANGGSNSGEPEPVFPILPNEPNAPMLENAAQKHIIYSKDYSTNSDVFYLNSDDTSEYKEAIKTFTSLTDADLAL